MGLKKWVKKAKKINLKKEAEKLADKVEDKTKDAYKEAASGIKDAGKDAGKIIKNTLKDTLSDNLALPRAISHIYSDVSKDFRKDFFKGLLTLGKSPYEIIKAAAMSGPSILGGTLDILGELGWGRSLNQEEKTEAKKVFGKSIPLNDVHIVTGIAVEIEQLLTGGSRPFTVKRVIFYKSKKQIEKRGIATLIHELTHVWQGQEKGGVYMIDSIEAQARKGKDAYKVTDDMLNKNKGNFSLFNVEQQAVIVERYWTYRWGPVQQRNEAEWKKYEPYARKVYN